MDKLPEDCLLEIFSYLSAEDLATSVRHVDTRWMMVSQRVCLWRHLTFTPAITLSEEDIAHYLKNMPNLWSFRLRHEKIVDKIVTALCHHCTDLRRVVMERKLGPSLNKVEELLRKFPNMELLDVSIPHSQFSMDYAKLSGKANTFNDLTVFRNISFRSISWTMIKSLGHEDPTHTSSLPLLEADIKKTLCERVNELQTIGLVCKLTSNILKLISYCKNLAYLFIDNETTDEIEIDFQPLSILKRLDTLQILCMHNSMTKWNMSYESVEFPRLVKLEIVNSGKVLRRILRVLLSVCPELKYLNVQQSLITNHDLETIYLCKHLVHLDVSENYILTDKCMAHVARGCYRLQFLDISNCCLMTGNVFKILQKCRGLQALVAKGNGFSGIDSHKMSELFPCLQEICLETPRWSRRRRTTIMSREVSQEQRNDNFE